MKICQVCQEIILTHEKGKLFMDLARTGNQVYSLEDAKGILPDSLFVAVISIRKFSVSGFTLVLLLFNIGGIEIMPFASSKE